MKKIKDIIKSVIYPPALFAVTAAVIGFASVAAVLVFGTDNPVLRYGSYLASAYALIITVAAAVKFVRNNPINDKIRSTKIGEKYFSDSVFRGKVSLGVGLAINLVYIAIKLVSGIVYRSPWFISLAVYYILLATVRLGLIRPASGEKAELRRCRFCGIVLLLMNLALAGIVIFIVRRNEHFSYPGYLIYAMAAYSFYAVIAAAISAVKTRRHDSPIFRAAKSVSLIAALVSILSLTTAMLSEFGGDDAPAFRFVMTSAVGSFVCLFVTVMAVSMILTSCKRLKQLE